MAGIAGNAQRAAAHRETRLIAGIPTDINPSARHACANAAADIAVDEHLAANHARRQTIDVGERTFDS
jgi:hypothetical protein